MRDGGVVVAECADLAPLVGITEMAHVTRVRDTSGRDCWRVEYTDAQGCRRGLHGANIVEVAERLRRYFDERAGKTYGVAVSDSTPNADGTHTVTVRLVSTEPLDALGRVVPAWAREAFDLLAKDGRRVYVGGWPALSRQRSSDALIYDDAPSACVNIAGNTSPTRLDPGESFVSAAQRALATEAERGRNVRIGAPVTEADMQKGMLDALNEAARNLQRSSYAAVLAHPPVLSRPLPPTLTAVATIADGAWQVEYRAPERRHNATCHRCFGPAYHGFGYAPTCERMGGCLADAEPAEIVPYMVGSERQYQAWGEGDLRGVSCSRPTAEMARTAWREAVLSRAVEEAVREGRIARPATKYWKREACK